MAKAKNGFFIVPNSVLTPELFQSAQELLLFIALMRFCNGGKVSFPSILFLAKICKISKTSVIKCTDLLESKNYITVSRKNNKTNLYSINPKFYSEVHMREHMVPDMDSGGTYEGHDKEIYINNFTKEVSDSVFLEEHKIQSEFDEIFQTNEVVLLKNMEEARAESMRTEFEKRQGLAKEITKMVAKSCNISQHYVESCMKFSGFSTREMELLMDKIRESDFLSGKLPEYSPSLSHFASIAMIYKILGGGYDNRGNRVPQNNLSYQKEFVKGDLPDVEPEF